MSGGAATGLSLWLMPQGAVAGHLRVWIQALATRHGGERFAPHLTLLSGVPASALEAQAAAARAASEIAPFSVRVEDVDGRDEYFRCLFARVVADPGLLGAHALVAQAFGRSPQPDFLPHVSLFYGTLTPEQKTSLRREAAADLRLRFDTRALHLWSTSGSVSSWRELAVFPLRG